MKCNWSQVPGCCGALTIYGYNKQEPGWAETDIKKIETIHPFIFASFINTKNCYKAYNELKEKYKLIYQSEPVINKNHGGSKKNKMFVCIYLNEGKT